MRKISAHYLALVALPLYVACAASEESDPPDNSAGSSSSSGTSSTAGATSTAGTLGAGGTTGTSGSTSTGGSGTAGSVTGSAGSVTGTAGTTGTAGAGGAPPGGACPAPTVMTPGISTFEMNVSNQLSAGTDVWSASPTGNTATAMDGALKVSQTGTGSWGSVSTLLNKGATCFNVDGKYMGIKFKISSPSNTSMKFIVVTPETKADSSHFGKVLTLTSTPTEVSVPWADLMKAGFGAGMMLPSDYKPAQHIIGLGFGVMMEKELMDIVLDDVTFY